MTHIQEQVMDDDRFATGGDAWGNVAESHTFRGVPESSRHQEAIARAGRIASYGAVEVPYRKRPSKFRALISSGPWQGAMVAVILACAIAGGLVLARWLS